MIVEDKYSVSDDEEIDNLYSLSPSSKFLLYLLKQIGPLSQIAIIKKTLLPKRTVVYALKKLQEKNFVKKTKDNDDKRISIFEVLI